MKKHPKIKKLAGQSIQVEKEFRAMVADKKNVPLDFMMVPLVRLPHPMALVLASLALVLCNNFQDSYIVHSTFIKVEGQDKTVICISVN